jgi:enoyl-CoA hydratase/carnithine racemase
MHASLRGAEAAVQLERRGAFWFARLNRPDKRNALSEQMLRALAGVCDEVARDRDAHALVLWGAGGHFCAGGGALALAEPAALRATKALVVRSLERPLGEALDGAAQDFARLLRLGAPREGIAASRERRLPAWRVPLPDLPEFT